MITEPKSSEGGPSDKARVAQPAASAFLFCSSRLLRKRLTFPACPPRRGAGCLLLAGSAASWQQSTPSHLAVFHPRSFPLGFCSLLRSYLTAQSCSAASCRTLSLSAACSFALRNFHFSLFIFRDSLCVALAKSSPPGKSNAKQCLRSQARFDFRAWI